MKTVWISTSCEHFLKLSADFVCLFADLISLKCRYHYLNHYAIFGGGYRGTAMSIMKKLYRNHGTK